MRSDHRAIIVWMSQMAVDPGLCRRCVHSQTVESSRGSIFWLCRLSFEDPRFRRYPPLPVVACDGYREVKGEKRKVESK
jgi:hypothetical protein